MTIEDVKKMDKPILSPAEVASVLHSSAAIIRWQAAHDASKLGFPCSRIGTRTKIPRLAFIAWFENKE